MSFTEFFENLSHEINDARTGRMAGVEKIRSRVGEIRTDVENFLDTFRSQHQQVAKELKQNAKELKRKLRSDDKARVKAAHELMGEIQTRIGGIFSFTHGLLHNLAEDLHRGGEIFRGNSAAFFPREGFSKESKKKKRK